jgi:hypothetical protein
MTTVSAPSQLPFTPKPFRNELFSSWMLRLAAANFVSLDELMLGFQFSYPEVPCLYSLDWGFHPKFPKAMARFCRTSERTLRSLEPPSAFASSRQRAPSQLKSPIRSMPAASQEEDRLLFLSNLHLQTTLCSRLLGMGFPCAAPLSSSQDPAQAWLSHL